MTATANSIPAISASARSGLEVRIPTRRRRARGWSLLAAIAVTIVVVGCSGANTPSASVATPETTATAGPSATSAAATATSAAATASPSATNGSLCAAGHTGCDLDAGSYSAAPFMPAFTFTVPAGWQNDRAFADGGGVSMAVGGFWWASGVKQGEVAGATVTIAPGVDGFVSHLQSFKGFKVTKPAPVTVDGVEGVQVDVTTNDTEASALYSVAEDDFNLAPDEKARFIVLDDSGVTVLFIIESYKTAGFDSWIDTTKPVLDSIHWD